MAQIASFVGEFACQAAPGRKVGGSGAVGLEPEAESELEDELELFARLAPGVVVLSSLLPAARAHRCAVPHLAPACHLPAPDIGTAR